MDVSLVFHDLVGRPVDAGLLQQTINNPRSPSRALDAATA
jgi:hypothetical protein